GPPELADVPALDRPLAAPPALALGPVDVPETATGRRQLRADLFELRQLLVPQRTRRPRLGLLVGTDDLPVPAGQRQLEQRLAKRLELVVGRLIRGRDLGDQGAEIKV